VGQSRMFGDDEPGDSVPSPRTTIVGGRPPEDGAAPPAVPTGMQTLLRLASVDASFRSELLERRATIAEAAGVALTPSEQRILAAIPAAQLGAMIDHLPAPSSPRRDFLRQTAATAVVLLGGAALEGSLSGCSKTPEPSPLPVEPPPNPTRYAAPPPDEPPPRPDHNEMQTEGGAAPEPPPPRPDYNHMAPGGVRPDSVPSPTTTTTAQPTRGIRPDIPPERDPGE